MYDYVRRKATVSTTYQRESTSSVANTSDSIDKNATDIYDISNVLITNPNNSNNNRSGSSKLNKTVRMSLNKDLLFTDKVEKMKKELEKKKQLLEQKGGNDSKGNPTE